MKILIVDDDKDFLEIMAERMHAWAVDVSTTAAAADAIKMVAEQPFDAVIMDFLMPALDGFNALKLLKKMKPALQIVLLSGNVPAEKRIEAIKLGALDVMEKPADLKVLIERIKQARKVGT